MGDKNVEHQPPDYRVLLYVPNIIGYFRLLLLACCILCHTLLVPTWALYSYIASVLLDFFDGYFARRLHQESAFGAWLDVVIDNLSRGLLWCIVYKFGYLVAAVEWLTFVCTHSLGAQWKAAFIQPPYLVQKVMHNNFRTFWGVIAISGLHVLPIWLFGHYNGALTLLQVPQSLQYLGITLLAASRALCMAVELWVIWSHIKYLLSVKPTG